MNNNEGKNIKGYRDLSIEEVALINKCKNLAIEVGKLCDEISLEDTTDLRWFKEGQWNYRKVLCS